MTDRPPALRPQDVRRLHPTSPISPADVSRPADGSAYTRPRGSRNAEPRRAVALRYDPAASDAPVVSAAGQGAVADEIIRRAREAGVPVTEDSRLAAVLSQIDVGQVIPPELYTVIAEVLAYVYRLEDRVNHRRF